MFRFFRATGSAAIAETLAFGLPAGRPVRIVSIRLHLSGSGGAETFTASIDSGTNAVYDGVIYSQSVNGAANFFTAPDYIVDGADEVDFALTNGGTLTWGLEVVWVPIG